MSAETGSLSIGGKSINLPQKDAVIGPSVLDISKLYGQSGMFTYDPGFTSTASCESQITYIDGDEGVLLYRGYPIEQLAEQGLVPGDLLPYCSTASCRRPNSSPTSTSASSATRWCTSRCRGSSRASVATRIRWR